MQNLVASIAVRGIQEQLNCGFLPLTLIDLIALIYKFPTFQGSIEHFSQYFLVVSPSFVFQKSE